MLGQTSIILILYHTELLDIHVSIFILHDLCKVCVVSAVHCSLGIGTCRVRQSNCTSEHTQCSVTFVLLYSAIIQIFNFVCT